MSGLAWLEKPKTIMCIAFSLQGRLAASVNTILFQLPCTVAQDTEGSVVVEMAHVRLSRIGDLAEKLLPTLSDAPQHLQVQEDLRALQRMLRRIQAVLNDAEKRWFYDESVRLWLRELKGVAYDAEDVLDEFEYELLWAKVEAGTLADEAAFLLCQRKRTRAKFEEIWRTGGQSSSHTAESNKQIGKLVKVELTRCPRCARLPQLGQLASLKQLFICDMDMVDVVGAEFHGPHTSTGFPALEELQFRNMENCVRWVVTAERGDFPCLRKLITVSFCDILESMAPLYLLPALEELEIDACPELKSIELWSSAAAAAAASSGSSASSTSQGPPSIRRMIIRRSPQVRLSWEDNELELPPRPPSLVYLYIDEFCDQLVEWCDGRGASWLARIPNATVWRTS